MADPGYRGLSLWWDQLWAERGEPTARPRLESAESADVAIVGAGYTGLWTAYYLIRSQPDLRIVILEAEVAGFGASGRNGGWCSALFPASIDKVARSSSPQRAVAMTRAMHEAVIEVGRAAAAEGIECDWHQGGTVEVARSPVQLDRLRAQVEHWRSWGFGPDDHRLLDADEARSAVGATNVLGATHTPHCARIQPAKLVRGLADVVQRSGVTIFEHSPATAIAAGMVTTDHGQVRAPYVVRATEAFSSQLPGSRRAVLPVYSLMLATEPLPAHVWDEIGLAGRPTFNDGRHLIIYGQRTADDRLAFGGRGAPYHYGSAIAPAFDRDAAVHAGLWDTLTGMFPAVADHEVTHRWGGPLGIPRDWYPSCGLDGRTGLAWAGGYVGDGVATSNLAGRTLADLILHRDTALAGLPWVNRRSRGWEPEPLRWIAVNAGIAVMSSADEVERRKQRRARRAAVFSRMLGQ